MTKISIISPVYKVSSFIARFVQSVAAQTFTEYELILVDDHTPDDSVAVALATAEACGIRQKVVVQKTAQNSGPGEARNVGISEAKGDFIFLCDSDDTLPSDALRNLYDAIDEDTEMCFGKIALIDDVSGRKTIRQVFPVEECWFFEPSVFLRKFTTFSTVFLYKKDFLTRNNICFPQERNAEDTCFLTLAILYASKVKSVDCVVYNYQVRQGSLTTANDPIRYLSKVRSMKTLLREAQQRGLLEKYCQELEYLYAKKGIVVGAMNYLTSVSAPQKTTLRELLHDLDETFPLWRKNAYWQKDYKARILLKILDWSPLFMLRIFSVGLRTLKVRL